MTTTTTVATRDVHQGDEILVPVEYGTRSEAVLVFDVNRDAEGDYRIDYVLSDGNVDHIFAQADETWTVA